MARSRNQKEKILYIAQYLIENTDCDVNEDNYHGVTVAQIMEMLEKKGINIERKTVYDDICTLQNLNPPEMSFDIGSRKQGKQTYYYLNSLPSEFELSELKILVDSVQAAKFISERQSKQIIRKIGNLCSVNQRQELNRNLHSNGAMKSLSSGVTITVDELNRAINKKKQVNFEYFRYDVSKKLVKKNKEYVVSPLALVWDNEFYYLVAYDEAADKIKHYRVDKIKKVNMLEKAIPRNEICKNFNASKYCRGNFNMYGSDTEQTITFEADKSLIGVIIDRFGTDIGIGARANTFTFKADVRVSQQFYGWLFGLGEGIKIVAPAAVAEEYNNMLKKVSEKYSK